MLITLRLFTRLSVANFLLFNDDAVNAPSRTKVSPNSIVALPRMIIAIVLGLISATNPILRSSPCLSAYTKTRSVLRLKSKDEPSLVYWNKYLSPWIRGSVDISTLGLLSCSVSTSAFQTSLASVTLEPFILVKIGDAWLVLLASAITASLQSSRYTGLSSISPKNSSEASPSDLQKIISPFSSRIDLFLLLMNSLCLISSILAETINFFSGWMSILNLCFTPVILTETRSLSLPLLMSKSK